MKLIRFAARYRGVKNLFGMAMAVGSLLTLSAAAAQSGSIALTQTAEYDIGFKCPVTATFNPDFTRLWVLMNSCGSTRYSLQAFDAPDWSPVTLDTGDLSEQLAIMDGSLIATEASAMAFTQDGTLDIRYLDDNTAESVSLTINTITGTVETAADAFVLSEETMNTLIPGFVSYPEFAVYNADHTLAAVPSDTAWTIIDLKTRTILFDIEDGVSEGAVTSANFSRDGSTLYMGVLNNPDDVSDYSATLVSYSLPDGEQGESVLVPSPFVWISPDETRAVALIGDISDALAVVDLTNSEVSPSVGIFEAPQRILNCLNRDGDVSDLNYMSSGKLHVSSLNWLPDSSSFVTVNTYGADGAGAGGLCAFNFSRLREYTIEIGT